MTRFLPRNRGSRFLLFEAAFQHYVFIMRLPVSHLPDLHFNLLSLILRLEVEVERGLALVAPLRAAAVVRRSRPPPAGGVRREEGLGRVLSLQLELRWGYS